MPGRVNEVLGWIDGLKKDNEGTSLDWHVHGIDQAIDLLERDHASWRRLVNEVGPDGMARGHWIKQRKPEVSQLPSILPVVLKKEVEIQQQQELKHVAKVSVV